MFYDKTIPVEAAYIAEELLQGHEFTDVYRKCLVVEQVINDGDFTVDEALELYEVTRADFDSFKEQRLVKNDNAGKESKHYDVFISFSLKDKDIAASVAIELMKVHLNCYLALAEQSVGDFFATDIREALISSTVVLLIEPRTNTPSSWVPALQGAAWALEKKVIPISFDNNNQITEDETWERTINAFKESYATFV